MPLWRDSLVGPEEASSSHSCNKGWKVINFNQWEPGIDVNWSITSKPGNNEIKHSQFHLSVLVWSTLDPRHEFLDCGRLRGGGVGGIVSWEKRTRDQELRLFRRERGGGVGGHVSELRTDTREWDLKTRNQKLVECWATLQGVQENFRLWEWMSGLMRCMIKWDNKLNFTATLDNFYINSYSWKFI